MYLYITNPDYCCLIITACMFGNVFYKCRPLARSSRMVLRLPSGASSRAKQSGWMLMPTRATIHGCCRVEHAGLLTKLGEAAGRVHRLQVLHHGVCERQFNTLLLSCRPKRAPQTLTSGHGIIIHNECKHNHIYMLTSAWIYNNLWMENFTLFTSAVTVSDVNSTLL